MARRDDRLKELLDRFVGVRLVKANGLDLTRFEVDWDLTFAVLILAPDGTVLGRYGSRSSENDPDKDADIEGLKATLTRALELNERLSEHAPKLAGKRGSPPAFPRPEKFPLLRSYGPKLAETGRAAKSCIHCHQVREAERAHLRAEKQKLPEWLLYPFPAPELIGLAFDPKTASTVSDVRPESLAAKSGFQSGDDVRKAAGQPLISLADFLWVLHRAPEDQALDIEVNRRGVITKFALSLPKGWRRAGDLSWRGSTWDLRRIALGGLVLVPLEASEREALKLAPLAMGLKVRSLGEHGGHGFAKSAGFQAGDILVKFGSNDKNLSESELLTHVMTTTKPGETVSVGIARGDRRLELKLPLQ